MFAVSCAGPVALTYAATHRERVRRLCLYGSYANGSDVAAPELRDALANLVKAHWGLGSATLTAMVQPGATSQESETFSRNQRDWSSASKAAELLCLSCDMNAVDALPRVCTETLVIHRGDDRTIPLEAGRRLAAELSQARFTVLDGNVHLPWIDGDVITDMVHSFLAGRGAAGTPPASGCRLDEAVRKLVLNGRHEPTTRLEYGVMRALLRASGRVV